MSRRHEEPARARHLADHRRPPLIGSLLRRPRDLMVQHLQAELRRAGHDLHRAHMVVFQQIDHDGTRITALAERVGVTKQTMVHLVDELARRGYLERVPDESDGRAKVVRMTSSGWIVHELAYDIVANLDRHWSRRLGRGRYVALRQLLLELNDQLDGEAAGGADLGHGHGAPREA